MVHEDKRIEIALVILLILCILYIVYLKKKERDTTDSKLTQFKNTYKHILQFARDRLKQKYASIPATPTEEDKKKYKDVSFSPDFSKEVDVYIVYGDKLINGSTSIEESDKAREEINKEISSLQMDPETSDVISEIQEILAQIKKRVE